MISKGGHRPHAVRFYETDRFLVAEVADFVGTAVERGGGGVVLATRTHLDAIEDALAGRGVDLAAARATGQYVARDAADTLAQIMVGGGPDETRLAEAVEPLLDRAAGRGREVRVFGELVALLWAEGRPEAALRLEALWNALQRQRPFSLLCGYPLAGFSRADDGLLLTRVCNGHSDVGAAESYELASPAERGRAVVALQQKARALEDEVSRRRAAEQALRAREAELSDFLENALEPMHQVGPDGTILWANRAELELLGYERSEYVGRHIADFHVDPPVIAAILARLRRGESLRDVPARLRCQDGAIKHVLIHSNALWENGKFIRTRCFTRDVTERWRAEQERAELLAREQAARMQADQANRAKDEFLATLSHELRTPLNAMLGWVRMLRSGTLDPATARRGLEVVERNVDHQARLIADLLDVSRIVSGTMRLEPGVVDLTAVVRGAVESIQPAVAAKRLSLTAMLGDRAWPIRGDAERLRQVVTNLLSNAVKFTPADGAVTVRLLAAGDWARIVVSDTGRGISPEFLPLVFERFRQADSSSTRAQAGLGLGLAIVRHIVELHGGTVSVESAGEGQGATFTIDLPAGAVEAGESPDPAPPVASGAGRERLDNIRVLVVDDVPDTREVLSTILSRHGADVRAVASVREALIQAERRRPDVIVCDIAMPGDDGFALIRQVRAIPAIALTAYARPEDRQRALAAGFTCHVAKPAEPADVVATVARVARRAPVAPRAS